MFLLNRKSHELRFASQVIIAGDSDLLLRLPPLIVYVHESVIAF